MTSTITFADKLRALAATTPERREIEITEAFWEDIKVGLEHAARQNKYCAEIKIRDRDICIIVTIDRMELLLTNLNKKCVEYDLTAAFIIGYIPGFRAYFTNINFEHFQNLVTADGCTYEKLSDRSFKISWEV